MNTTVAIDPGASGGIVIESSRGVVAHAMPGTEGDIVNLLSSAVRAAEGVSIRAVVEQVGGYAGGAGQPGSAMFRFGQNFGFLLGVLAALRVRVELVRPQAWQKALSLGTSKIHASKTAWKNHLKSRAQQLFPNQTVTLKTADALLLLEYARRADCKPSPE